MNALNQLFDSLAFDLKLNILLEEEKQCKWYQFRKQIELTKRVKELKQESKINLSTPN